MDQTERVLKPLLNCQSLSCAAIELSTYVVQTNVGIQDVHEFAKGLVGVVSSVDPRFVRVRVSNQLSKVYDTAQHVAEAVQIFDNFLQLVTRLGSSQYAVRE